MGIWQNIRSIFSSSPSQATPQPSNDAASTARVHQTALRVHRFLVDELNYYSPFEPQPNDKIEGSYTFMVSYRGPTDNVLYNFVVSVSDVGGNDYFELSPGPKEWNVMHPNEAMIREFFTKKRAEIIERNSRIGR